MKKLIFVFALLIISFSASSQYNDTLYFKSGYVKAVSVRQHDEKFLYYEYRGKGDNLVENRIPISKLKSFVIYDEYGREVYNSLHPKKEEEEKSENTEGGSGENE